MFAPLPPLLDRAGRPQEGREGLEVWSRTPTHLDELEVPPVPLDLPALTRQFRERYFPNDTLREELVPMPPQFGDHPGDNSTASFRHAPRPVRICTGCSKRSKELRRCTCCKDIKMKIHLSDSEDLCLRWFITYVQWV
eukprot:scaffold134441_cov69-Attheya_sp.AAC.5